MFELTGNDYQAIWLSARVATLATLLALPAGFAVAALLVFVRLPGKALLEGLVNLPLVLPPVVVGYLLLVLLGQDSWLGGLLNVLGIRIIFTWKAAVLAALVVGFPLLVRSLRIGMESIDKDLLAAARTLGASWHDLLFTMILPLSWRSMLAGATLMFARGLGEFGATIMIAGNIAGATRTIPLAIYDYTAVPGGDGQALTLCLVAISLSLTVLLVNERLVGRRCAKKEKSP